MVKGSDSKSDSASFVGSNPAVDVQIIFGALPTSKAEVNYAFPFLFSLVTNILYLLIYNLISFIFYPRIQNHNFLLITQLREVLAHPLLRQ